MPGDQKPLDQHDEAEEGEAQGREDEDDGEGEVHAEIARGDLDVVAEAGRDRRARTNAIFFDCRFDAELRRRRFAAGSDRGVQPMRRKLEVRSL